MLTGKTAAGWRKSCAALERGISTGKAVLSPFYRKSIAIQGNQSCGILSANRFFVGMELSISNFTIRSLKGKMGCAIIRVINPDGQVDYGR